MRAVPAGVVEAATLKSLGLDGVVESLTAVEAVAALVRRAAGFLCPGPARRIVDRVESSAGDWLGDDPRELIREALDELVLHGDLVEVPIGSASDGVVRTLYLAVPSYVVRSSGAAYLHGVVADHPTALPAEFEEALRHRGVVRWLEPLAGIVWDDVLGELAYTRLDPDRWFGAPSTVAPREHQAGYTRQLDRSGAGGDTSSLTVIDPAASPTFYTGRRVPAGERTGRFVGRRERRFGRALWCYVELGDGQIVHLFDLDDPENPQTGADAAWHLQMALDACAGTPQRYVLRDGGGAETDEGVLGLFSPVPSWAERRLLTVGRRLPVNGRGELMSIAVPQAELEEEARFLERALWLKPV